MNDKVYDCLARSLIRLGPHGEHWQQGAKANDKWDVYCALVTTDHEMRGGHAVYPRGLEALLKAGCFASISELIRWNDHEGRTFNDIKKLFAVALAGMDGDGA